MGVRPTPRAACFSLAPVPSTQMRIVNAGVQSSFGAFDQAKTKPSSCIHLTWTEPLAWLFSWTVPWRVYLEVRGSSTISFSQNEFPQFAEFDARVWAGFALSFRRKKWKFPKHCVKLSAPCSTLYWGSNCHKTTTIFEIHLYSSRKL